MPKRKSNRGRRAIDQGFVKSLAHPLRVEILSILIGRMASPNELSKELDEGLSQVSYHVKVLKNYETIELVKTEPRRGAVEHYYRATSKTLFPAKMWRGIDRRLRAVIDGSLVSDLFDDVAEAVDANKLTGVDSHIHRLPVVLDAEGWRNLKAGAQRFTELIEEEQRASAVRAAKANGDAAEAKGYTVGVLAFEDSRDLSDNAPRRRATKSASANGKGATAKGKVNRAGSRRSARKGKAKAAAR